MVALASAPRDESGYRIFFESPGSSHSRDLEQLYDGDRIKAYLKDEGWIALMDSFDFPYTDVLHIIMALFQSQPLSLKFLGMKRVFELELDVKHLPRQLQVTAKKEEYWLDYISYYS